MSLSVVTHTTNFDAQTKVLFLCGDYAKGRAEDCGEPPNASVPYPGVTK